MEIVFLWTVLAAIAAWGAYVFARRDPPWTSWIKIVTACLIVLAFGLLFMLVGNPASFRWLGEGVLAHIMLFIVWPLGAVGVPLCVGLIIGTLVGIRRAH